MPCCWMFKSCARTGPQVQEGARRRGQPCCRVSAQQLLQCIVSRSAEVARDAQRQQQAAVERRCKWLGGAAAGDVGNMLRQQEHQLLRQLLFNQDLCLFRIPAVDGQLLELRDWHCAHARHGICKARSVVEMQQQSICRTRLRVIDMLQICNRMQVRK